MSKEVKRFFIMPGAVSVMQSDSQAYTPMTNHETYLHTVPVVLGSDYEALLAERDALKKDAERYRWLRIADWWNSPLCVIRDPKQQAKPGADCPSRDRLDEAIDAALQGEQP